GERLSVLAVLTWIGIGIVVLFVLIALLSPVLAPWDPLAFVDGPDVPPWSNAPIVSNSTYFSFSSPGWLNMTDGQAIDGRSATSSTVNDSVIVSDFLVRIRRESITDVTYLVLLDGRRTTPGHYLGVEYSRSEEQTSEIQSQDHL